MSNRKNDLRTLKYRTIKNAYHDTQLARRAREWSEEKIYKELGIKLPKNIPKLRKDVTENYKKSLQTSLYKYQSTRDKLINAGVNKEKAYEIASKYRKRSYKHVEAVIRRYTGQNIKIPKSDYWNTFYDSYVSLTKSQRIKQWSEWAKSGNDYPKDIYRAARKINKEKGLDNKHSLGWAVVYQGFLHNQDINILKKEFSLDRFLPETYQRTTKL